MEKLFQDEDGKWITWNTWVLDSEEILWGCQELNLSPKMIARVAENVDTVAHYFNDKVAALIGNWDEWLRDAIEETIELIEEDTVDGSQTTLVEF